MISRPALRTFSTTMATTSAKVLRIGKVFYAQSKWEQLAAKDGVEVIPCTLQTRQEFLQDLKTKYKDVTNVTRTFESVNNTGRFDEEVAQALPASVKTVSHCGAGYDQVDIAPLTARGIQVSNVTTPVEAPTADTAVFLLLDCLRNFSWGEKEIAQWPHAKAGGAPLGREPRGKTVGILGMGGIGRAIRDRLQPFGFGKIQYYNRNQLAPELEKSAVYCASLDEFYATSDIILISVPLNSHTFHMINHAAISKMKDGVILINTARGAVVDESQLIGELKLGKVGSYGSDVFENEPAYNKELVALPNVVALPHMGTHAVESIQTMEEFVVENVESYLQTGKVMTIVPEQYNAF